MLIFQTFKKKSVAIRWGQSIAYQIFCSNFCVIDIIYLYFQFLFPRGVVGIVYCFPTRVYVMLSLCLLLLFINYQQNSGKNYVFLVKLILAILVRIKKIFQKIPDDFAAYIKLQIKINNLNRKILLFSMGLNIKSKFRSCGITTHQNTRRSRENNWHYVAKIQIF